jgi:catechol 2,3-dioxygenase-like lactoylglutathione lyase family enzyme
MALQILEIHHPALRIDGSERGLAANLEFYEGVLGLAADPKRPTLPGIPGLWINLGEVGQLHLIGGDQPSPLAKDGRTDRDPTAPHVALAVADVVAARAEIDRMGVDYWVTVGMNGKQAQQLFLRDPNGNMIEIHQVDQCRCRASSRRPAMAAE